MWGGEGGGCNINKNFWYIDLKRSVDLRWLFDPALHSSMILVFNRHSLKYRVSRIIYVDVDSTNLARFSMIFFFFLGGVQLETYKVHFAASIDIRQRDIGKRQNNLFQIIGFQMRASIHSCLHQKKDCNQIRFVFTIPLLQCTYICPSLFGKLDFQT